jgi:hypothetical protein
MVTVVLGFLIFYSCAVAVFSGVAVFSFIHSWCKAREGRAQKDEPSADKTVEKTATYVTNNYLHHY